MDNAASFNKTVAVIRSCKTIEQMNVAHSYSKRYYESLSVDNAAKEEIGNLLDTEIKENLQEIVREPKNQDWRSLIEENKGKN